MCFQKWFGLYLEGILPLKISEFAPEMRDFASENAAPEIMWVEGGGIELPCKYYLYAPKKYRAQLKGKQ